MIRTLAAITLMALGITQGHLEKSKGAPPRFEDYPAQSIYSGHPAKVDFRSDPNGRLFKTRLREGIKAGANFAGEYTIVSWGCGTSCQEHAILHTPTGKICAWFESCAGEVFHKDSRLLVVDPPGSGGLNSPCKPATYFLWDGKRLKQL